MRTYTKKLRGSEYVPAYIIDEGREERPKTVRYELDDGSWLEVKNLGDRIEIRSDGDHRVVMLADVSNVVQLLTGDYA